MGVSSHRELEVWRVGIDLVEAVYRASKRFPPDERFGLTTQAQRAAVSIPANIAEGFGRMGSTEFRRFLAIARGSLFELDTHLTIAGKLGYLAPGDKAALDALAERVGQMLTRLMRSLQTERSTMNNARLSMNDARCTMNQAR